MICGTYIALTAEILVLSSPAVLCIEHVFQFINISVYNLAELQKASMF